jgi:hypothetical protein
LPPSDVRALEAAPGLDTLVYRGTVHAADAPEPAFVYERRVGRDGDEAISSHVTMRPGGEVVVLQRARHAPDYSLRSFEAIQRQTGVRGSVRIEGDRVELSLRVGSREVVRSERLGAPLVVGPTLFGVILRHWDALRGGERIRIRFADVDRSRTYAFTLRCVATDSGHTRIEMRADNLFVRATIRPMTVTFDTATRRVVRYEGRVPPLRETARGLRPFDARVEYHNVAAEYR